jgi:hypothetical protein
MSAIIRVVRHRRGIVEFWIPEHLEGSTLQLVRWPIQDETKLEYDEVLAARQQQFAGMFKIIGEVSAIERLLERLETGWVPKRDEIDRDIRQVDLTGWVTLDNRLDGRNYLAGFDQDNIVATGPVLHWGPNRDWALTPDGFYWLEAP